MGVDINRLTPFGARPNHSVTVKWPVEPSDDLAPIADILDVMQTEMTLAKSWIENDNDKNDVDPRVGEVLKKVNKTVGSVEGPFVVRLSFDPSTKTVKGFGFDFNKGAAISRVTFGNDGEVLTVLEERRLANGQRERLTIEQDYSQGVLNYKEEIVP